MYVCLCNRINDQQVKSAIETEGLASVRALRRHFEYPEGCCGKCTASLREMLNEHCQACQRGACPAEEQASAVV